MVAVIEILGTTQQALSFLGFVTPTVVALLAILRGERNAQANEQIKQQLTASHESHLMETETIDAKLDQLREAIDKK